MFCPLWSLFSERWLFRFIQFCLASYASDSDSIGLTVTSMSHAKNYRFHLQMIQFCFWAAAKKICWNKECEKKKWSGFESIRQTRPKNGVNRNQIKRFEIFSAHMRAPVQCLLKIAVFFIDYPFVIANLSLFNSIKIFNRNELLTMPQQCCAPQNTNSRNCFVQICCDMFSWVQRRYYQPYLHTKWRKTKDGAEPLINERAKYKGEKGTNTHTATGVPGNIKWRTGVNDRADDQNIKTTSLFVILFSLFHNLFLLGSFFAELFSSKTATSSHSSYSFLLSSSHQPNKPKKTNIHTITCNMHTNTRTYKLNWSSKILRSIVRSFSPTIQSITIICLHWRKTSAIAKCSCFSMAHPIQPHAHSTFFVW